MNAERLAETRYYAERLSAERLKRCYDIAPPRIQQYLDAEIRYVLGKVRPSDVVLELGCGYGRVLERLAGQAGVVVGIDNSASSVNLAAHAFRRPGQCHLAVMDAGRLAFHPDVFDMVVCIQNGISAFKIDPVSLIEGCVRVARPGGVVLLSSYADAFWEHRLDWFERQAAHGLVGEIDRDATRDGVIACRDGFRSRTFGPAAFETLCSSVGLGATITEVDQSSVFCEIRVP